MMLARCTLTVFTLRVELLGDRAVGVTLADQMQDFEFPRAQPVMPFATQACGGS